MLVYASRLIGTPIISVQAAGEIAVISDIFIDPDGFKIIAFRVVGATPSRTQDILPVKSIREFSTSGIVIDSVDELVEPSDVIAIQKVIDLHFFLPGLKVETRRGTKLGRVLDFTVTDNDFYVQQIIVKRPLAKSFLDPELTVPRSEIVELTDYKIIVKDEEKAIRARAEKEDFIPNFVNPFRTTAHAKEKDS